MPAAPLVVKFGGELLENRERLQGVAAAMARVAAAGGPLVIVHGGGKEIDAALKTAGIEKRQVDGLRITDEPTLEVVVSVLAGAVNTRLVAALDTAGADSGRSDRRRRGMRPIRGRTASSNGRRRHGRSRTCRHPERRLPTCGC